MPLRHEVSAEDPRWRGLVEHLPSSEGRAFLELETMLSFPQRFGVEANDRDRGRLKPGEA